MRYFRDMKTLHYRQQKSLHTHSLLNRYQKKKKKRQQHSCKGIEEAKATLDSVVSVSFPSTDSSTQHSPPVD